MVENYLVIFFNLERTQAFTCDEVWFKVHMINLFQIF